jgi:sigma54-dependent transcription regulator
MANKKKKKKSTVNARRVLDLETYHHMLEQRVVDLEKAAHFADSELSALHGLVDSHIGLLRNMREAAQREAELRVQAESMVYRKMIHTLLADRKGVDMFLDKLSDLAPEIAKGVLVGTFEDEELVAGVRPERADDSPTAG